MSNLPDAVCPVRHNGRVRTHRTLRHAAGLTIAASLVLAGCGGDDDQPAGAEGDGETPTATPSPTSTIAIPAGVTLTALGSELGFGDAATVEYSPNQRITALLDLTVSEARAGRLKDLEGFNLNDDYRKNANYYYVDVEVTNVGDTDLGGRDIPLNGVNGDNVLLPPVVFQSAFEKCPSEKLPKNFGPGDSFSTCLVYLSPDKGELSAVSYRPTAEIEPITWTGEVGEPEAEKKPNRKKRGNQQDDE